MALLGRYSAVIFLSVLFFSCEGDYDIRYEWTGLDAMNADNLGDKPEVSAASAIPAKAYVLKLNLYPVELSRKGRYLDRETPPSNSNPMDSILVTCNKDFSALYPAGSSLNKLFVIFNDSYLHTFSLESGSLHITNAYSSDYYDNPLPQYANLLLMQAPDTVLDQCSFKVRVQLQDGTVFIDSTSNVKIY